VIGEVFLAANRLVRAHDTKAEAVQCSAACTAQPRPGMSEMQTVGNYTLLETVGQGTFGEVMLAMERHTRESVAVKVLLA